MVKIKVLGVAISPAETVRLLFTARFLNHIQSAAQRTYSRLQE